MSKTPVNNLGTAAVSDSDSLPPIPVEDGGTSIEYPFRRTPWASINFGLLIILAVIAGSWIAAFTDWLPVISEVISGGSILTLAALVTKHAPEQWSGAIRDWLYKNAFSRAILTAMIAIAAGILLFFSFMCAPIQIDSLRDFGEHAIAVFPQGSKPPAMNDKIEAGTKWQKLVWPWFGTREFVVHVNGFPERHITVRPWRPSTLSCPEDLRCPVLLLVPTPDLVDQVIGTTNRRLEVSCGNQTATVGPLDGRSIWIGCGEDVVVPESVLEPLRSAQTLAYLPDWKRPVATLPVLNLGPSNAKSDNVPVTIIVKQFVDNKPAGTVMRYTLNSYPSTPWMPQTEQYDGQ